MHLQRVITALIALPVLIFLILRGGAFLFTLFITAAGTVALNEYYKIIFSNSDSPLFSKIKITGYVFTVLIILSGYFNSFPLTAGLLIANFIAAAAVGILVYKGDDRILGAVTKEVVGVIYIPMMLSLLVMIRCGELGVGWIFLLLLLVASGDTGAYYAGTYFGKRKLCPEVSPGKTVEGFLGGAALSLVTGMTFKFFILSDLSFSGAVLLCLSISIVGPMGDLFESLLKRVGKIKDSGTILPGHGGLLDRIDALLFAAPVAYYFKEFLF